MNWVDIGVNLSNGQFRGEVDTIINNALAAGVTTMLLTGTCVSSSQSALAMCQHYRGPLYCTAGIHPHDAEAAEADAWEVLRQLAGQPWVKAIGETGLDFNRNYSSQTAQIAAFETQLQLAAGCGLPLFLHERDAFDQQWPRLRDCRTSISGAVVHCFTGNARQLQAYLELDLYVGITGWICDPKRGAELRQIVHMIPDDRLLLETDAPFLIPKNLPPELAQQHRRRNEPALLPWVAATVAAARGQTPQHLATITSANAQRLFNLPDSNH